jgi:predicted HTH domain antitoxin
MKTVTISMRLPEEEVASLAELARELGTERPAFLRQALRRGARDLMFERACQAYRTGAATLSRAAEMADIPLRDMILRLEGASLELNYGVKELRRDLQE